jgi:hypothetical protein
MDRDRHFAEPPLSERAGAVIEDGRTALTVEQILAWADAHHAAHGVWPAAGPGTVSGVVAGAPGESWKAINHALALGLRGLPGDSSLAELLAEHRGATLPDMSPQALAKKIWAWEQEQFPAKGPRHRHRGGRQCPPLTIGEILAWADAHREATGDWPTIHSGRVQGANFELTWSQIQSALKAGYRGLPGNQTLRGVLVEHRDVGVRRASRTLTVEQVLAWADDFRSVHGCWPTEDSGAVAGAPGERWSAIEFALNKGRHGLPGGTTLLRLIEEHRDPQVRQRSELRSGSRRTRAHLEHARDGIAQRRPRRGTGFEPVQALPPVPHRRPDPGPRRRASALVTGAAGVAPPRGSILIPATPLRQGHFSFRARYPRRFRGVKHVFLVSPSAAPVMDRTL